MKILVVEDDPEQMEFLETEIRDLLTSAEVFQARSKAETEDVIHQEQFDLAIVDLRIPSETGRVDPATSHGSAVLHSLRSQYRGLPLIIYSAYAELRDVGQTLAQAPQHDILGTGERFPLIRWIPKDEPSVLLEYLRWLDDGIRSLESVRINYGMDVVRLGYFETRVLQLFAHRRDGRNIWVTPVPGGMAGARVMRVTVRSGANTLLADCIVKINHLSAIDDEYWRYSEHVAPNLRIGDFAHHVESVQAGASHLGGLFFRVADECTQSLFGLLRRAPEAAAKVVEELEQLESHWRDYAPPEVMKVHAVRQEIIKEDELSDDYERLVPSGFKFETTDVQVRRCTQHGDLHGGNVLVKDSTGAPVMIDYGDVGVGCSALDPVTLELSLLFHPASPLRDESWPSVEQCRAWTDLDRYLAGCPVPDFVRACRSWSYTGPTTDSEVASVAYAYAVRQLKYRDTDHERAAAIAEGCSRV